VRYLAPQLQTLDTQQAVCSKTDDRSQHYMNCPIEKKKNGIDKLMARQTPWNIEQPLFDDIYFYIWDLNLNQFETERRIEQVKTSMLIDSAKNKLLNAALYLYCHPKPSVHSQASVATGYSPVSQVEKGVR